MGEEEAGEAQQTGQEDKGSNELRRWADNSREGSWGRGLPKRKKGKGAILLSRKDRFDLENELHTDEAGLGVETKVSGRGREKGGGTGRRGRAELGGNRRRTQVAKVVGGGREERREFVGGNGTITYGKTEFSR